MYNSSDLPLPTFYFCSQGPLSRNSIVQFWQKNFNKLVDILLYILLIVDYMDTKKVSIYILYM